MQGYEVGLRTAEDNDELARIYRDVFGEALSETSRRRWQRQYFGNPTSADRPVIWVVRQSSRPLGQMGTMPVALWWGEREVRASWGMDFFVRRDAEGRGLGAMLTSAWTDHVDVALAMGLTPPAYVLYKRMGFRDLGHLPFLQKIVDPTAVARRRLGDFLGTIVGPALGLGIGLLVGYTKRPAPSIDVRNVSRFSTEYDQLWEEARSTYAMCVRRDTPYLNWKYGGGSKNYEIHEARREGKLVGFAVSRHEVHRGLRLGWIVDVFAKASDHEVKQSLIATVLAMFRQLGVARAQAFCLNAELAADLKHHGFFGGQTTALFCVKSPAGSEAILEDRDRWHVVFGDGDMDR